MNPRRTLYVSANDMERLLGKQSELEPVRVSKDSKPLEHDWKLKGLRAFVDWLDKSDDVNRTIKTWAEVYIQCGPCKRKWEAWIVQNPPTVRRRDWSKKAIRFIIRKSLI